MRRESAQPPLSAHTAFLCRLQQTRTYTLSQTRYRVCLPVSLALPHHYLSPETQDKTHTAETRADSGRGPLPMYGQQASNFVLEKGKNLSRPSLMRGLGAAARKQMPLGPQGPSVPTPNLEGGARPPGPASLTQPLSSPIIWNWLSRDISWLIIYSPKQG